MAAKTKKGKKVKKNQKYECQECGLVISIDECCGCADYCDLMCCGAPLRLVK